MRRIPFAYVPEKSDRFMNFLEDIFETKRYLKGLYNQRFSEQWAQMNNADYCLLTSSGTTALFSTLKVLLPREKSKVIVPNVSYSATVDSVIEAGHIPVYCKVLENGLIDQEEAKRILKEDQDILGIIIVHLYGQHIEIDQYILDSIIVIEDACQAHGALDKIQGQVACFSFYPSKNLGTIGDGGAVLTNIPGLYDTIEKYINCGDAFSEKYVHSIPGLNLRMDEIKAAYLLDRVNYLFEENTHREVLANRYRENGIIPITNASKNVYHLFPILVENPENFRLNMSILGIETGQHYPYTLSKLRAKEIVCGFGQKIAQHNVTLPMGPHLSNEEIDYVCEFIHKNYTFDQGFWYANKQSSF